MFLVSLRLLKTHHKLALWRVQVYGLNKPLVNKAKQKCHSNSANACPMRWVWCGDRNCLSLTKGRNICSFAYEFDLKSFDLSLGTFHKNFRFDPIYLTMYLETTCYWAQCFVAIGLSYFARHFFLTSFWTEVNCVAWNTESDSRYASSNIAVS